jgi:hypothetical protein
MEDKMIKKTILGITISILLSFLFPTAALAQLAYAVTPSKAEHFVNQGETVSRSINVYNKEAKPIKIKAYVMDYRINQDGGFVFSAPGSEKYSAASWIELGKTDLTIPAKKPGAIPFTLTVPTTAETGGHYAVIFIETAQKTKKEGVIRGRIGSLNLVVVKGKVERQGRITGFEINSPFNNQNIKGTLTFKNQGNVHLTTRSKVAFFDILGRRVAHEDLGDITILPGTKRTTDIRWNQAPIFGRFKAVAYVSYGNDMNTFTVKRTATQRFAIIPWRYLAAGSFVFMCGAVILVGWLRRRRLQD